MLAQNSPAALKEKILAQKNAASLEQTGDADSAGQAAGWTGKADGVGLRGKGEGHRAGSAVHSADEPLRGRTPGQAGKQRLQLTAQMEATQEDEQATDEWLVVIRDYTQLEELDRPTLLRLLKRIEVGEKFEMDGKNHRDIKIYCNFVGHVEFWTLSLVMRKNCFLRQYLS